MPYERSHMIGKHQIDTLIVENDFIEYREQKSNTQLDTEKFTTTVNKILNVVNDLKILYRRENDVPAFFDGPS